MSDEQAQGQPLALPLSAGLGAWVPVAERLPATGTECVVLLRYSMDRPPFVAVDTWDVQREDPTGMGGPTLETGEGWNDNYESDVIAWIAIPQHPPAEWDQRLPEPLRCDGCGKTIAEHDRLLRCNAPNVKLSGPNGPHGR